MHVCEKSLEPFVLGWMDIKYSFLKKISILAIFSDFFEKTPFLCQNWTIVYYFTYLGLSISWKYRTWAIFWQFFMNFENVCLLLWKRKHRVFFEIPHICQNWWLWYPIATKWCILSKNKFNLFSSKNWINMHIALITQCVHVFCK